LFLLAAFPLYRQFFSLLKSSVPSKIELAQKSEVGREGCALQGKKTQAFS